ncbi:MAG: JDVT-CTERM system glutamic-type intramembrane protease [Salinisphaeraceae bacterium]
MAILVYPVVEEWLFRGELQPRIGRKLIRRFGPLSAANLVTSALFTALHLLFHPPGWALAVFLPSLVFGYFRDATGGLAAPMLLHGFYNACFFVLLLPV